jgi:hypothetical protein
MRASMPLEVLRGPGQQPVQFIKRTVFGPVVVRGVEQPRALGQRRGNMPPVAQGGSGHVAPSGATGQAERQGDPHGDGNYINRLVTWVEEQATSDTTVAMIRARQ